MLLHYRLENAPANEKVDSVVARICNQPSEEAKSFEELPEDSVILKSDKGTF